MKITKKRVRLLEIDDRADWKAKPTPFDLDDVTRVEFGGRYEEALHLIGGLPGGERPSVAVGGQV